MDIELLRELAGRMDAPPFGDADLASRARRPPRPGLGPAGVTRSRSALGALRAAVRGHTTGWARCRRAWPSPRQSDAHCWRRWTDLARSPFAKAIARSAGFGSWTGSALAGLRNGLLSPHRASGRREDPRREGHHPGAQRDVGDGRRAGIHARRRVGLDLRGSRTLERGVCGVARVQSREPLRGTRSDCARARTSLWLTGPLRRRRWARSDGSR